MSLCYIQSRYYCLEFESTEILIVVIIRANKSDVILLLKVARFLRSLFMIYVKLGNSML